MELKTLNPLFLDSTRSIGDKKVTTIELNGDHISECETVFVEILHTNKSHQRLSMNRISTKKSVRFCLELLLEPSENLLYRFLLASHRSEGDLSRLLSIKSGEHQIHKDTNELFDIDPTKDTPEVSSSSTAVVIRDSTRPLSATVDLSRRRTFPRPQPQNQSGHPPLSQGPLITPQISDLMKALIKDLS